MVSAPRPASRMREEIGQIPQVVARLLDADHASLEAAAAALRAAEPRWVSIVARGTSDHAAVYARYVIETYLGIPVSLAASSVATVYGASLDWGSGALLAISQSGQGTDVVAVTEQARRAGALTVAITNDPRSPLARSAEHVLLCRAGPERAVPATKTYTSELALIAGLVARRRPGSDLAAGLARLPAALRASLDAAVTWLDADRTDGGGIVEAFAGTDRALVVSRGFNLATALEVALKLKETSGIFAEAYSSADLQHGPLVLAGAGIPVLVFRPDGPIGPSIDEAVAGMRRRGAQPWLVGGREVRDEERALALPIDLPEALTPLTLALPGQLLAECVAKRRGLSPDVAFGMTKVTLTR